MWGQAVEDGFILTDPTTIIEAKQRTWEGLWRPKDEEMGQALRLLKEKAEEVEELKTITGSKVDKILQQMWKTAHWGQTNLPQKIGRVCPWREQMSWQNSSPRWTTPWQPQSSCS